MAARTLANLEQAVHANPDNAGLRHLLAAEYAQTGNYESAKAEFFHAITLEPGAHVARLQLGLLLLALGDPTTAMRVWAPLETLAEGSALKHFKRGLEALIRKERDLCERHLTAGIAANTDNLPLNDDIRRVLSTLRAEPSPVRTDFSLYGSTRH